MRGRPQDGLPIEDLALNPTPSSPALHAERIFARAVESPLVRGGLTIVAGVLTGNILGLVRVAVIAYLLGTRSHADSLAVAMGPLDTLNSVLINSIVFAFVPMLTAAKGEERTALFLKLARGFVWVCSLVAVTVILAAPWLMRALAPGLDPAFFDTAVNVLRILALSTPLAGVAAVHSALLYTDRRFGPAAFYQAAINVFTIVGALCLWKVAGVFAFAIGYSTGAAAQLAIVYFAARSGLDTKSAPACAIPWNQILAKPAFFVIYAASLGLNTIFTRAYATNAGPGMAAALDYGMRGVAVPLALLVNPISNSILPEIARLRSALRLKDALRLIDRTVALTALAAMAACGVALIFREQAIALLFQRGRFTAESTRLVATVFFTLAPSLVGWSLIEIMSRSLFALDKRWPPVLAAIIPVIVNSSISLRLGAGNLDYIGLGSSIGLFTGFAVLFLMAHVSRRRWLAQG